MRDSSGALTLFLASIWIFRSGVLPRRKRRLRVDSYRRVLNSVFHIGRPGCWPACSARCVRGLIRNLLRNASERAISAFMTELRQHRACDLKSILPNRLNQTEVASFCVAFCVSVVSIHLHVCVSDRPTNAARTYPYLYMCTHTCANFLHVSANWHCFREALFRSNSSK